MLHLYKSFKFSLKVLPCPLARSKTVFLWAIWVNELILLMLQSYQKVSRRFYRLSFDKSHLWFYLFLSLEGLHIIQSKFSSQLCAWFWKHWRSKASVNHNPKPSRKNAQVIFNLFGQSQTLQCWPNSRDTLRRSLIFVLLLHLSTTHGKRIPD